MSIYLLLLLQLPPLLVYYYQVAYWIKRDAALFALNPANDTFHQVFHLKRLLVRMATSVLVALVPAIPLARHGQWLAAALNVVALLSIGAGYWSYAFNPGLNRARKLAYVPEYYVSFDPNTAYFPDRMLWARACRQVYPDRPVAYVVDPAVQAAAGELLKKMLRRLLRLGTGLYLGLGLLALAALLRHA